MGDVNADFKCRFGEELMSFTADNALQISEEACEMHAKGPPRENTDSEKKRKKLFNMSSNNFHAVKQT